MFGKADGQVMHANDVGRFGVVTARSWNMLRIEPFPERPDGPQFSLWAVELVASTKGLVSLRFDSKLYMKME